MLKVCILRTAATAGLMLATSLLYAQNYPDKPVRMVVPFAAGGGSDTTGRIVGQRLSELLGKNILIDNRAGAAGLIGTELVAHAPADGYTLLLADASHSSNPFVYRKAAYDAIKDFAPISLVATTPVMFCIHPSVPVRSIHEFISLARREPNKLSFGSGGVGSLGRASDVPDGAQRERPGDRRLRAGRFRGPRHSNRAVTGGAAREPDGAQVNEGFRLATPRYPE